MKSIVSKKAHTTIVLDKSKHTEMILVHERGEKRGQRGSVQEVSCLAQQRRKA